MHQCSWKKKGFFCLSWVMPIYSMNLKVCVYLSQCKNELCSPCFSKLGFMVAYHNAMLQVSFPLIPKELRAPDAVIGKQVPKIRLQEVYGIKLPCPEHPEPHENQNKHSPLRNLSKCPWEFSDQAQKQQRIVTTTLIQKIMDTGTGYRYHSLLTNRCITNIIWHFRTVDRNFLGLWKCLSRSDHCKILQLHQSVALPASSGSLKSLRS